MVYEKFPGVDNTTFAFPPIVRSALVTHTPELETKYAHLNEDDQLEINGIVIETGGTPVPVPEAGLDTLGFLRAVFIENGGTIPPEAVSPYIVVIEQE